MVSVQTTVKQRRNMYFGLFDHYRRKGYPSIKIVILVHILHGLTHLNAVAVRFDLYDHAMQFCFDLVIIGMEPCIFLILQLLQFKEHIKPNLEQALRQRKHLLAIFPVWVLSEILKVAAVVKNLESALVLSGAIDVFAQSGTSSDHLNKFDF